MRTAYHQALDNARLDVVRLGALTLDAIRSATHALERRDGALAARVIAGDDEIDDTRRRVETACIELIWKQQPVAGELRQIAGMLQIVTDLERIGDYAVDIAKNAIKPPDVDVLYRNGIEALQAEMQHDPGTVPAGTLLLFVVSIIERVGDRAQNIAWHT